MTDKNTFNPAAWQTPDDETATNNTVTQVNQTSDTGDISDDIELITCRIEAAKVDITQGYDNWLSICFSISSVLGENGRSIFHRVSRFHPEYDEAATDKQYDKCLRSKGSGITIKTFFAIAKNAGIDIRTGHTNKQISPISPKSPKSPTGDIGENGDLEKEETVLPTFFNEIKDKLPNFLRKIGIVGESPQESDSILLGALTVISGCLPKIYGIYNDIRVYSNLYYFLTARAASGKGRLNLCRNIVNPIHKRRRDIYKTALKQYDAQKDEWESRNRKNGERGPKPQRPNQTTLFIAANNSATGVYQLMDENDGQGIFFESEGDTLTSSFKNEFGDFSDGLRKAFHHEHISLHRRSNNEDIDIETPRLSVVLAGTPRQVVSLIGDAENGLFSRFMFYRLNSDMAWKDVFASQKGESMDMLFTKYGEEFLQFYDILAASDDKRFSLTQAQCQKFFTFFNELQSEYYTIFKEDIIASVRRLGLICFRIAMIISSLRIMDSGDFSSEIICTDDDFDTTITICRVLAVHMTKVFSELSSLSATKVTEVVTTERRQRFLDALPDKFDRQDYVEVENKLGIPDSTAQKWIKAFSRDGGPLVKVEHGFYRKRKP